MRLIIILIIFATMNSFRGNEAHLPKLEATKARVPHFVEKTARPREKVLFCQLIVNSVEFFCREK